MSVEIFRESNRKKTERLYPEEGLKVRRCCGRLRAMGTRAPIPVIAPASAWWSPDFVHNPLSWGRRFRVLNIVDNVNKECLGAIAVVSLLSRRVIGELDDIISRRAAHEMIVSDKSLPGIDDPFHDHDALITICDRLCMHRKKKHLRPARRPACRPQGS